MKRQIFNLQPFPSLNVVPKLKISGNIARRFNVLVLKYLIEGRLEELSIPAPSNMPSRLDGLWKETCLELFLAVRHDPKYWEFNFSPAGHWNVYRFTTYRLGMQEEAYFTTLPITAQRTGDCLLLSLELDLTGIVRTDLPLDVGISTVVKQLDGNTSYWALKHAALQPDFHNRESFAIQL